MLRINELRTFAGYLSVNSRDKGGKFWPQAKNLDSEVWNLDHVTSLTYDWLRLSATILRGFRIGQFLRAWCLLLAALAWWQAQLFTPQYEAFENNSKKYQMYGRHICDQNPNFLHLLRANRTTLSIDFNCHWRASPTTGIWRWWIGIC